MIRRAQSLDVEFQRRVDHAFGGVRERFEFGIMRRDESRASAFEQVTQDRARQRRALLRIGARAEFVEDDERTMVNVFEDANDVGDVTAERAERLLDGLLVADVGKDAVKKWNLRAALRGDVQSALRHEGEQADRFERNRFAARVWSRDDDRARPFFRVHVNRHGGLRIEEGMAGVSEINFRFSIYD